MDLRSSKSDVRTHRRHKRDPRICAEKRVKKLNKNLLCYVLYCRLVYMMNQEYNEFLRTTKTPA